MHILDKLSLEVGLRASTPFVYEKYFPINYEKYICLNIRSSAEDSIYKYWEEVLDLCQKELNDNGYGIINIGQEINNNIISNRILDLGGKLNFNQIAYLIKNCDLYIGPRQYEVQLASFYKRKILNIVNKKSSDSYKPYWSKEEDCVAINLFADNWNNESEYLKPEFIAQNIFDILNIKKQVKFKTIFVGKDFSNKTLEIIPDRPIVAQKIPINNPIVRMDYYFNESILEEILRNKKTIIFTNKPIDLDLLTKYKQNIDRLIYIIREDHVPNFIERIKSIGIKYVLISELEEEEVNKLKINYIDLGIINIKPKAEDLDLYARKNIKYKSSKILISGDFTFFSKYDWENNLVSNNEANLNKEFLEEIDNFYLFSIDN